MSIYIQEDDQVIWAYKLPNGEVCVTPDYDFAEMRGNQEPTLIFHLPHE